MVLPIGAPGSGGPPFWTFSRPHSKTLPGFGVMILLFLGFSRAADSPGPRLGFKDLFVYLM